MYGLTGHGAEIQSIGWSSTGDHLVSAGEDITARVWDVSPRAQILTGHDTDPMGISDWSPDGTRFATASFDSTARIWDTNSWEALLVIPRF